MRENGTVIKEALLSLWSCGQQQRSLKEIQLSDWKSGWSDKLDFVA